MSLKDIRQLSAQRKMGCSDTSASEDDIPTRSYRIDESDIPASRADEYMLMSEISMLSEMMSRNGEKRVDSETYSKYGSRLLRNMDIQIECNRKWMRDQNEMVRREMDSMMMNRGVELEEVEKRVREEEERECEGVMEGLRKRQRESLEREKGIEIGEYEEGEERMKRVEKSMRLSEINNDISERINRSENALSRTVS